MSKAFTLIELLVVISILTVLMSLLLPSLYKARRQARGVVCSSNLHSLSHGLQIYASEYNGWIPRESVRRYDTPFVIPLVESISYDIVGEPWDWYDQFGDIPVLQCPDFPEPNVHPYNNQYMREQHVDYVVNAFPQDYESEPEDELLDEPNPDAFYTSDGRSSDPPIMLSRMKNVSGVIFLTEAHRLLPTRFNYSSTFHDVFRGKHLPRGKNPRIAVDIRHPGGINAAFFDGHVSRLLPASLKERHFYFPK